MKTLTIKKSVVKTTAHFDLREGTTSEDGYVNNVKTVNLQKHK